MRKFCHILCLFWAFFLASKVRCETYIFTQYASRDGLCNNYVHDIVQDRDGFLWVATHYGISKFDGHHFSSFFLEDYPMMERNDFYHAFLLADGKVAFAGSRGVISSYNRDYDRFDSIPLSDNSFYDDITGFTLCSDESLISTSGGLFSQKNHTGRYTRILPFLNGIHTLEAQKDSFGRYWIGTFKGLTVIKPNGEKDSGFEQLQAIGQMINNVVILEKCRLLLCSSVGSAWIVTLKENGNLEDLRQLNTPFKGISEVLRDDDGSVWVGTAGNGLWHLKPLESSFSFERILPPNKYQTETEKITALTKDTQGNIWIGTQNSGLFRVRQASLVESFSSADIGLNKTTVTDFIKTKNGDLLFGTDGQGIFVLDSTFKEKKHISIADGLPCNNILSLNEIDDYVVCTFWGGEVTYINQTTFAIERETYAGLNSPTNMIKDILTDKDGNLWACTAGDGIYVGKRKGTWRRTDLSDPNVMADHPDKWTDNALQGPDGRIWLITSRTIWMQKGDKMTAIFPDIDKDLTHNPLMFFAGAHDKDGNLFVVSNKGICRFSADGCSHGFLDFIPSGSYKSIVIDNDGTIWASGSNGIISIRYNERKYKQESSIIQDKDYFVANSSYMTDNGEIYFGNNDGFIVINNRNKNNITPLAYWEDLYIHGKKIKPNTDVLPKPLINSDNLSLKYSQTNLRLIFNLIDYASPNDYTAEYRILPIESTWNSIGQDRDININHLSAGQYTVEVRFSKNRKVIKTGLKLELYVSPPWWLSWWFKSLCTLITTGAIALVIYARFRRIKRQKEKLEQMVQERTVELDKANKSLTMQNEKIEEQNEVLLRTLKDKDQLISIVAHDLKNPMFAIVCSIDDIIKSKRNKQDSGTRMLTNVKDSAVRLQQEMVKLLNWATGKDKLPECDIKEINVNKIAQEVTSLLSGMADEKKIEIVEEGELSHLTLADARMASTIIMNSLSNAIKFTPEGNVIRLTLSESETTTNISVQDSGIGMTAEQIRQLSSGTLRSTSGTNNEVGHGLGFKIIKDFVEKNNGTLDVSSEEGKGTTVFVSLPISENLIQQNTEELEKEKKEDASQIEIDANLLKDKSILIVDDDPLLLLHLKKLLEPYVLVNLANDGESGLAKAKEIMPDLTISDIDMPKMDGFQMYEKMRSNSLTSHIPLLFVTASNDDKSRFSGLSSGAIDYITKPFDDKELLIKICNFLTIIQKQQIQFMMESQNSSNDKKTIAEPNPLLKKLLDVIKENYTNPEFSFDDTARALCMSKATLSRRLKSLTDKSPMEILSDYRLYEAKKMLERKDGNISEIAYKVGYNDPLYFSKKFKDAFGISPSKI